MTHKSQIACEFRGGRLEQVYEGIEWSFENCDTWEAWCQKNVLAWKLDQILIYRSSKSRTVTYWGLESFIIWSIWKSAEKRVILFQKVWKSAILAQKVQKNRFLPNSSSKCNFAKIVRLGVIFAVKCRIVPLQVQKLGLSQILPDLFREKGCVWILQQAAWRLAKAWILPFHTPSIVSQQ